MRKVKVEIGGKTYEVAEMGHKDNEGWRQEVLTLFGPVLSVLEGESFELSGPGVQGIISSATALVFRSVGLCLDLMGKYSPHIKADRERIEAEGFDSEITDAFLEVMGLAFPFFRLASSIQGLVGRGLEAQGSKSESSPKSENGSKDT